MVHSKYSLILHSHWKPSNRFTFNMTGLDSIPLIYLHRFPIPITTPISNCTQLKYIVIFPFKLLLHYSIILKYWDKLFLIFNKYTNVCWMLFSVIKYIAFSLFLVCFSQYFICNNKIFFTMNVFMSYYHLPSNMNQLLVNQ